MNRLIIALGRSDNHALLAKHARSIGVEYLALEGFEASEMIRDPKLLRVRFEGLVTTASLTSASLTSASLTSASLTSASHIAAIDSSISPATLRSFVQLLEREFNLSLSVRSDPGMLEDLVGQSLMIDETRDHLLAVTIARSPHGQVAIWPIVRIDRDGSALPISQGSNLLVDDSVGDEALDAMISNLVLKIAEHGLVGLMTIVIDAKGLDVVHSEFGLASITFWSESASYTSTSEQLVRAILDLPLGDTRLIDFEEFYLKEDIDLPAGVIADPIRPFLHLFARNPRLKVSYPIEDFSSSEPSRCVISLFASSQEEALMEMAHARDFMRGLDE